MRLSDWACSRTCKVDLVRPALLRTSVGNRTQARRLPSLLATCLKKRGEHDRAEEVYTQGLLLDIRHEELWLERVDNLQLAARHEDALLVIDDGLTALQEAPNLSYRRFISLYASGQHKAAFDLLEFLLTHHYDQSEIL